MPRRGPPTLERMSREELARATSRKPSWYRPVREHFPPWYAAVAISVFLLTYLYSLTGEDDYVIAGLIILVMFSLIWLRIRAESGREWKNAHTGTELSFDRVVIRVRNILREADVPFELKGMESSMGPALKMYTEVFQIGEGLDITVWGYRDTAIYIGPVNHGNRKVVEWLKGLVDDALD